MYHSLFLRDIRIGTGDTPHSVSVVTVGVVCTRVDVATVYVQAVRVVSTVRRTRPPVAVGSTVVEGAIVDAPGIQPYTGL